MACNGDNPASTSRAEFAMLREARDTQRRRSGIRAEADLDAGVVEGFEILQIHAARLFIDRDFPSIAESLLAPGRVGKLRGERRLYGMCKQRLLQPH